MSYIFIYSLSDVLLEQVSTIGLFYVSTRLNLFSNANSSGIRKLLLLFFCVQFKLIFAANRCWHITRLYPASHISVCGIWLRHRLLQPESDSCDTRLSMTTKTIWSPSWLRGKNTMLSHPWRIPSPTLYKWVHYLSLATLISWVCLFFCRQLQWSQISYSIWFTRTRTSKTIYGIGAMRLRQYLIASLLPSWASRNHPSQPAAIRLGRAIDIRNQFCGEVNFVWNNLSLSAIWVAKETTRETEQNFDHLR